MFVFGVFDCGCVCARVCVGAGVRACVCVCGRACKPNECTDGGLQLPKSQSACKYCDKSIGCEKSGKKLRLSVSVSLSLSVSEHTELASVCCLCACLCLCVSRVCASRNTSKGGCGHILLIQMSLNTCAFAGCTMLLWLNSESASSCQRACSFISLCHRRHNYTHTHAREHTKTTTRTCTHQNENGIVRRSEKYSKATNTIETKHRHTAYTCESCDLNTGQKREADEQHIVAQQITTRPGLVAFEFLAWNKQLHD